MRTALITGASRGIGRHIAIEVARTGLYDCIAICCRSNAEYLNETAKTIRSMGLTCIEACGDVGDYAFMKSFVNTIQKEAGSIDLVVNNAAVSYVGLLTDMTKEDWDNIVSTNLNSVFNTCHLTVPDMVRNQRGKIINISSVWGVAGASCEVAYSATKGAVNAFTKALAKELALSHISVNAIAYGAVNTEMNHHLDSYETQALCEEIPMGRMAEPEEAAVCLVNLLKMPEYFTGEIVNFNGGWI